MTLNGTIMYTSSLPLEYEILWKKQRKASCLVCGLPEAIWLSRKGLTWLAKDVDLSIFCAYVKWIQFLEEKSCVQLLD